MGQILHGSARTTETTRRAIQNSQESLRVLAARYGINVKTVAKWRKRDSVGDARMGLKAPSSTVLSKDEEALIVAFRKHALLALDDCLYALQESIPHLTRSSLLAGATAYSANPPSLCTPVTLSAPHILCLPWVQA